MLFVVVVLVHHVLHVKLSKVDLVGLAPNLEVSQFLQGGLLGGQHEHNVLVAVLAHALRHLLGVGPDLKKERRRERSTSSNNCKRARDDI